MSDLTVAKEILRQLGGNRALAMIGAKNVVGSDDTLTIQWKAKAANKANGIRITLNARDLYDITFLRVWGGKLTEISKHEDYYNDMLVDLFENETKLYLSF